MAVACLQSETLILRIRSEYCEMPGLKLTLRQAQRLWALDERTCESLLDSLVHDGFLIHSRDGSYVRQEVY